MAAPEYVPRPPDEVARVYGSPPWRPDSWKADRPGDLRTRQPLGERLGRPGPDQGYVLHLARRFEGTLSLNEGESEADAIAGCVGVALKRASLFGRAPVIHDLTMAFAVWGFLDEAPAEQIVFRRPLFDEVANPHHYEASRMVVDLVPESTLRLTPDQARERSATDWRSLIGSLDEIPDAPLVALPLAEPEPAVAPEPIATVAAPTDAPAPSEPSPSSPIAAPATPPDASEPALRPAAKVTLPPAAPQRPTAKKKVIKKKVIKKITKKKVAKKKAPEGDDSLFARPQGETPDPADETGSDSVDEPDQDG